jgi:hypothetical protein
MPPLDNTNLMLPEQGVMNGVVRKVGTVPGQVDEALVRRLGAAINVLEQHDENLVDHLEKLAQVATSDPVKFKGLLSMLDLL